jgi:hypothetical protein
MAISSFSIQSIWPGWTIQQQNNRVTNKIFPTASLLEEVRRRWCTQWPRVRPTSPTDPTCRSASAPHGRNILLNDTRTSPATEPFDLHVLEVHPDRGPKDHPIRDHEASDLIDPRRLGETLCLGNNRPHER